MTDDRTPAGGERRPDWMKEAESALEKATQSLSAAWDATRDTRMSALEMAKQAASQLGEAIDRGVDAAKEVWQEEGEGRPRNVDVDPPSDEDPPTI